MNVKFIDDFINMCISGSNLGWHERNGGNLSYRIKDSEIEEIKESLTDNNNWINLDINAKNLANEYFLVTGSGKYFMNINKNMEENIGIIKLDENGESYKVVWGFENNGTPTSELPSHLLNHSVKKEKTNGLHRVIYHAHTTNIIALTFVLPLEDKIFSRKLWEMATECPVVFPQGVGVLPWMIPGGKEIAKKSSELMEKYNAVIWAHHGLFSSGEGFEDTFGLAHTIEKAAEVLVKVLSISNKTLNTISKESLLSLENPFNIELNKNMLD